MRHDATKARAAAALLAIALIPAAAGAGVADPFAIKVTNPWPHNLVGGYWPAAVTIENLRDPVDAVIMLIPRGGYSSELSSVERPVTLSRGETARVVLPVPVRDWGRYQVQVYVDGYQTMRHPPHVDAPYSGRYGRAAGSVVIAVARDAPDLRQVEAVMSSMGGGSAGVVHATHEQLPDLWQPYSSAGLCAVDVDALVRMSPAQRSALGTWVFAGGACLIHPVTSDEESRKIIDGLGLAGEHRDIVSTGLEETVGLTCASIGLGRVLFLSDDAFPQTADWWRVVLSDKRNVPISERAGADERSSGLDIPGVGEPPVTAFLVISIFFIILIGPANWYIVLKRMKKPPLFLVSTPVLAIGASVLMLTYSFISEGFGTHVSTRTIAVLDPEAHRGVTWSRHSVYAGVAPYGGLKFSSSTLVMPEEVPPGRKSIAWSDGLRMKGGWLPARTKCSYVTCAQYPARWRVRVARAGAGWSVTNGLPVGIKRIVFGTPDGIVSAENVPPGGAEAGLMAGDASAVKRLGTLGADLRRFGVRKVPADFLSPEAVEGSNPGGYLRYVATLDGPLGAELGIEDFEEEDGRHAVIGLAELGSR